MNKDTFTKRDLAVVICGITVIAAVIVWLLVSVGAFDKAENEQGGLSEMTSSASSDVTVSEQQSSMTEESSDPEDIPSENDNIESEPEIEEPAVTTTVDAEFFNDACFIGDFISMGLRTYSEKNGDRLGEANYLFDSNLGVYRILTGSRSSLSGTFNEYTYQEALELTKAKKVFIMLGMNDCVCYGTDVTIERWKSLVSGIHQEDPDIDIYIMSATPIVKSGEKNGFTNKVFDDYNSKLKEFAAANGCKFIDINTDLKNGGEGMDSSFSSDGFCRLNNKGFERLVDSLYEKAGV